MVSLIEIDFEQLRGFIEIAYNGDEDLLTKYHVEVFTLQEAVDEEIKRIEFTNMDAEISCFGVMEENEKIGYLCVFTNHLYSFCININYRIKSILNEFWIKIKEVLGLSFICMIYPNNIRAIKWLKKNGMIEVEGVTDFCITLLNIK